MLSSGGQCGSKTCGDLPQTVKSFFLPMPTWGFFLFFSSEGDFSFPDIREYPLKTVS